MIALAAVIGYVTGSIVTVLIIAFMVARNLPPEE